MNDVADVVQTFHGGCPHDCPDTCAMQFHVKNGELVSVSGNPDHPMTRGGLCVKLKDYEKRHYHPNRLLYPMKRVGPKGTNQFERITWDEALDTIVDRWQALIKDTGPRAILPVSYLANPNASPGTNATFARSKITSANSSVVDEVTPLKLRFNKPEKSGKQ